MTDEELWETYWCGDPELNTKGSEIMAAALLEVGYPAVVDAQGQVVITGLPRPTNEEVIRAANIARKAYGIIPIPDVATALRLTAIKDRFL
jgi:hypothetical protein